MPGAAARKTLVATTALTLALSIAAADGVAVQRTGHLRVRESFDASQGIPTEGYVSYLVVRRARGGEVVLRESQGGPLRSDSVLSRGRYRLHSFIRICDGNCGLLDLPTGRCATDFRLAAGADVKAKILRDAAGCRVSVA
jgi:hypothetical protein